MGLRAILEVLGIKRLRLLGIETRTVQPLAKSLHSLPFSSSSALHVTWMKDYVVFRRLSVYSDETEGR